MDRKPPTRNMQSLDNLRKMKWKHKEYMESSKNRRKNNTNSPSASQETKSTKSESDKENDTRKPSTSVRQTNDDAPKSASQVPTEKEAPKSASSSIKPTLNMSHDLDQLLDRLDAARLDDLEKAKAEIIVPKTEEAVLFNNLKKAYQESNFPSLPSIATQSQMAETEPKDSMSHSPMTYNAEISAPYTADSTQPNQAYSGTFQHQIHEAEPASTLLHASTNFHSYSNSEMQNRRSAPSMPTLSRMEPRGTVSQPTFNSNSSLPYSIPETQQQQQDYGYSTLPPNRIHDAEPAESMSQHTLNLNSQFSSSFAMSGGQQHRDYSMPPRSQTLEMPALNAAPTSATNFSANIAPSDTVFGAQQDRRYPTLPSMNMRENEHVQPMSQPPMYVNSQVPSSYPASGTLRNQEYSASPPTRSSEMSQFQRLPPSAMLPPGIRLSRFYPELHSNDSLDTEPVHSMSASGAYLDSQVNPSYPVQEYSVQEYSTSSQGQLPDDMQQFRRVSQIPPPVSVSGMQPSRVHSTMPSMGSEQFSTQSRMYLRSQALPYPTSGVPENQEYSLSSKNQLPDVQPLRRMSQIPPPDLVRGIRPDRVHSSIPSMESSPPGPQPGMYPDAQMNPSYSHSVAPENQGYSILSQNQLPDAQPLRRMSQIPPPDPVHGFQPNRVHSSVPSMESAPPGPQSRMYLDSQMSASYSGSDGQVYSSPSAIHGGLEYSTSSQRMPDNNTTLLPRSSPDSYFGVQTSHAHSAMPSNSIPSMQQSMSQPGMYQNSHKSPPYSGSSGQLYSSSSGIGAHDMESVRMGPSVNFDLHIPPPPHSHPGVNRMLEEELAKSMSQAPADFYANSPSDYPLGGMPENHLYPPQPQMEPRTAIPQPSMYTNPRFPSHVASDPPHNQMHSAPVPNRTLERATTKYTHRGNFDTSYSVSGMQPNEDYCMPPRSAMLDMSAERISQSTLQTTHAYSKSPADSSREMELAISLSQQSPITYNPQISRSNSGPGVPQNHVPAHTRLPETDPIETAPPMNFVPNMYQSSETGFQEYRPPNQNRMLETERYREPEEPVSTHMQQGQQQFPYPPPFAYEHDNVCQEPPPQPQPQQDRVPSPARVSGQQHRLNRYPSPQSPVSVMKNEALPTESDEESVELMPDIAPKIFYPRSSHKVEVSQESLDRWNNPSGGISWKAFGESVKDIEKMYLPVLTDDKGQEAEEDPARRPGHPVESTLVHSDARELSISESQSLHSSSKAKLQENEQSRHHKREFFRQNFIKPPRGILKRSDSIPEANIELFPNQMAAASPMIAESKKVSFDLMP